MQFMQVEEPHSGGVKQPQQAQQERDGFVAGRANKPISFRLIDFEWPAYSADADKIAKLTGRKPKDGEEAKQALKDHYASLVSGFFIGREESKPPKTIADMLSLWKGVSDYLWGKYEYAPTRLLSDGLLEGHLDCDTFAYAAADILAQSGVHSKILFVAAKGKSSMSGHALLEVSAEGKQLILDTVGYGEQDGMAAFRYCVSEENLSAGYDVFFKADFNRDFFQKATKLLLIRALAALEAGRYEQALADFQSFASRNAGGISAQRGVAQSYLGLGKYEQAIEQFNSLLHGSKKPKKDAPFVNNDAFACIGLGNALLRTGQAQLAQFYLEKAVEFSQAGYYKGASRESAAEGKIIWEKSHKGKFSVISPGIDHGERIRFEAFSLLGDIWKHRSDFLGASKTKEYYEKALLNTSEFKQRYALLTNLAEVFHLTDEKLEKSYLAQREEEMRRAGRQKEG